MGLPLGLIGQTAWLKVHDTTYSIDWNDASIVIKDQNTFTGKPKEAILIKAANPGLKKKSDIVQVPH